MRTVLGGLMNLEPKNYLALLDSIIRTDPTLLDTLRSVLKAYLKLDPYEDLLEQMIINSEKSCSTSFMISMKLRILSL